MKCGGNVCCLGSVEAVSRWSIVGVWGEIRMFLYVLIQIDRRKRLEFSVYVGCRKRLSITGLNYV